MMANFDKMSILVAKNVCYLADIFGKDIRDIEDKIGFTRDGLAKVDKMYRGFRSISVDQLCMLADIFDVDVDVLMSDNIRLMFLDKELDTIVNKIELLEEHKALLENIKNGNLGGDEEPEDPDDGNDDIPDPEDPDEGDGNDTEPIEPEDPDAGNTNPGTTEPTNPDIPGGDDGDTTTDPEPSEGDGLNG